MQRKIRRNNIDIRKRRKKKENHEDVKEKIWDLMGKMETKSQFNGNLLDLKQTFG